MNLRDKLANIACLLAATVASTAIFRAHILYVAHHATTNSENEAKAIRFPRAAREHISPVFSGVGDRSSSLPHE